MPGFGLPVLVPVTGKANAAPLTAPFDPDNQMFGD